MADHRALALRRVASRSLPPAPPRLAPPGLLGPLAVVALVALAVACGGGGGSGSGAASGAGLSGAGSGAAVSGPVPAAATGGPGLAPAPGTPVAEGRALWVTRWHANTEAKVRAAVDQAARLGFNMLLLQVQGDGAALYPSSVLPRSTLVSAGFDPLALAVPLAHARGIEVHAWINAVRVYHGGAGLPSDPAHVMRKHPEWSMVSASGVRSFDRIGQSGAEIYACPEQAGFRDQVVAVGRELAAGYAIDGLHLDYIRYPGGTEHCYCDAHRQAFQVRFGRAPTASDPDWRAFRFTTIDRLIADIGAAARAARPGIALSATKTRFFSFQDADAWFERSGLDILFPMLYTSDLAIFERETDALLLAARGRHVMPGLSADATVIGEEIDIARRLGAQGFALFASSEIDAQDESVLASRVPGPGLAPVPAMHWRGEGADPAPPRLVEARALAGQSAVTVEWRTDEPSLGRVELRLAGATWAQAVVVHGPATPAREHRVTVGGLASDTDYVLHAVAVDASGNWRSSSDIAARTLPPGPIDVVVDDRDAGYQEQGAWSSGSAAGGNGGDYRYAGTNAAGASATASFRPALPEAGLYRVSTFYIAGTNRSREAAFTVEHAGGASVVRVDQTANGRTWVSLGAFRFDGGSQGAVVLANDAPAGAVVIADAVRFERLGP